MVSAQEITNNVLEITSDSVIVTSLDGSIERINSATESLLGYLESELQGKHFSEISDVSIFRDTKFSEYICNNVNSRLFVYYTDKNGSKIPMSLTGTPVRDLDGNVSGVIALARDMREVQELLAEVSTARSFNDTILKLIPTGLITVNDNKKILTCNPSFLELVKPAKPVGLNLSEVLSSPEFFNAIDSVLSGDSETREVEITNPMLLRRTSNLILNISIVRLPDAVTSDSNLQSDTEQLAQSTRALLIIDNITERERSEQLETDRKMLGRSVKVFQHVLGIISHELRNPLAGARAATEYLLSLKDELGSDGRQFVGSIRDEMIRMATFVNNVVEVAKLESGSAEWIWSPFEMDKVCKRALSSVEELINSSEVELVYEIETPQLAINGDDGAIERLIRNLLKNAHEHTTKGTISLCVQTLHKNTHDFITIEVKDTGSGLPPDKLSKLGYAFELNSGIIDGGYVTGSGLGLSICKGIAIAHGGKIFLSSKLGEGTAVTVEIRSDLLEPAQSQSSVQGILAEGL